MKRASFAIFLAVLLLCLSVPAQAATTYVPDYDVQAEFVYLYNVNTEQAIYEKNAGEKCYPASVTKIMTCILALENTPDLDSEFVTYPTYVQDYLYTYQLTYGGISLADLSAGERMSMRDMLYGLMLQSGNEIAMSIADHIGGSQAGFVEMMNRRAKELGARNTNFVNPNGLFDENHYTTAYDIAQITLHAMSLPGFMDIVSTTSYVAGPTNKHERLEWTTTNMVMIPNSEYYNANVRGVKTGTLPESGRCFVSTATKDGFTYLLVVMNSPYLDEQGLGMSHNYAFDDANGIYNWVFGNFKVRPIVEMGKYLEEIPLRLSLDQDYLQLMTAERFTALVHKDVDLSTSVTYLYDLPDSVDAPVRRYDKIGTVTLMLHGETIGTVDLLAAQDVAASGVLVLLEKIKGILRSFWFKFAVVFLVLLIILYILLMIVRNRNRRRRSSGYKPRRRI